MGQAKRKTMTSRELADEIDKLVGIRILQSVAPNEDVHKKCAEAGEITVRRIADALKRLDHNGGVCVEGDHKT